MQRYSENIEIQHPGTEICKKFPRSGTDIPPNRSPLGNTTNNDAASVNQHFTDDDRKAFSLKYSGVKKSVGTRVNRVKRCGCVPIPGHKYKPVEVSLGETGRKFYRNMQRCGAIWLCPQCHYKIMKQRADELFTQLMIYRKRGLSVMFISLTFQHFLGQKLETSIDTLFSAYKYALNHRQFRPFRKNIEFLRTLEITYGQNGWHPHIHALFVGSEAEISEACRVFTLLYTKYLSGKGLTTNKHTVSTEKWNGNVDNLKDYLFKGMLEKELTGGGLKKGRNGGKTFFELIEDGTTDEKIIQEYIRDTKGRRQFHSSRGFFRDVRVKTDQEVLKDDKTVEVLYTIPRDVFNDMRDKGITDEFIILLNHSVDEARKLLELYEVDADFMGSG